MECHRKMPVPSAGTLTGNSNSPGGKPVPSSFPVLPVAAPAGWNLPALVSLMIHALPPQGQPARFIHISGKTALNRPGNTHNKLLVTPSEKFWRLSLPDSVFRPGCYSFCVRPGPHYPPAVVTLWDRLFWHTHADRMCHWINKHSSFYEILLKIR